MPQSPRGGLNGCRILRNHCHHPNLILRALRTLRRATWAGCFQLILEIPQLAAESTTNQVGRSVGVSNCSTVSLVLVVEQNRNRIHHRCLCFRHCMASNPLVPTRKRQVRRSNHPICGKPYAMGIASAKEIQSARQEKAPHLLGQTKKPPFQ